MCYIPGDIDEFLEIAEEGKEQTAAIKQKK